MCRTEINHQSAPFPHTQLGHAFSTRHNLTTHLSRPHRAIMLVSKVPQPEVVPSPVPAPTPQQAPVVAQREETPMKATWAAGTQGPLPKESRRGDWSCSCGNLNFASRSALAPTQAFVIATKHNTMKNTMSWLPGLEMFPTRWYPTQKCDFGTQDFKHQCCSCPAPHCLARTASKQCTRSDGLLCYLVGPSATCAAAHVPQVLSPMLLKVRVVSIKGFFQ